VFIDEGGRVDGVAAWGYRTQSVASCTEKKRNLRTKRSRNRIIVVVYVCDTFYLCFQMSNEV
jgi:hypothetical protein